MNYDVIIVGAGPAGLSASIELTKREINHALIDPRRTDQVERKCAGMPEAVKEFDLPYDGPIYGGGWIIKDRRFDVWGKLNDPKRDPLAYLLDEHDVRESLLKRSDAELIEERVVNVHRIFGGIEVSTEERNISAPLVIDCSGTAGVVASNFLFDYYLGRTYISWGFDVDLPIEEFGYDEESGVVMLEDTHDMYGSVWQAPAISPGRNHTTSYINTPVYYGVVTPQDLQVPDRGKSLAEKIVGKSVLPTVYSYFPDIADEVSNNIIEDKEYWGIVRWWPLDKPYADNLLIAGDSAGHVSTLAGIGVWPALCHGKWAGITAADAVVRRDFSEYSLSEYQWFIDDSPYFDRQWTKITAKMCDRFGTWLLEMFARQACLNVVSEGFDINEATKIFKEYKKVKHTTIANFFLAGAPGLSLQLAVEAERILRGRKWKTHLTNMRPIVDIESDGGVKFFGGELRRLVLK